MRRLRQVTDLYTTGKVVELKDGTPLWVQPLNPFEQDTARSEAQIAKARISMAIREEGHDERAKVRSWFTEDGPETARERLVDAKVTERTGRLVEGIRNDPDWTERLTILERGTEGTASPLEPEEERLLLRIASEYAAELGSRIANEREFQIDAVASLDEETLWTQYLEWYVNERAGDVMMAEFRLAQMMHGVRWCEGTKVDGRWDHAGCESHVEKVFPTKEEARVAPADLLELLTWAMDDVDLTSREAKNSDRQGSSSGSSPLPSEGEESTASTPNATQPEPPGSSSSPSPTPSPSSAGAS